MKTYTITVNGNVYEVSVEEGTNVNGNTSAAPVAKAAPKAVTTAAPVKAAPAKAASGTQGSVKVTSPMPGKILDVKVSAGQAVKRGQVVCVLEAMKMENEIVAPSDGTIASVNVAVGANVEVGEVLATLS